MESITINETVKFALLCFTSLYSTINPMGVIPIYISMTGELAEEHAKRVVYKAVFISFILLMTFALGGQFIFTFFGISVNGFKIVGGTILFTVGYNMLMARTQWKRGENEGDTHYAGDISISPLAIPVIAGPGTIAMTIVLMQEAETIAQQAAFFGSVVTVLGVTALTLLFGRSVIRLLGENGGKIIMRLMGLILMVVAVEFFVGGLKPIIRDILNIHA